MMRTTWTTKASMMMTRMMTPEYPVAIAAGLHYPRGGHAHIKEANADAYQRFEGFFAGLAAAHFAPAFLGGVSGM